MKTLLLTLTALFAFGTASAQMELALAPADPENTVIATSSFEPVKWVKKVRTPKIRIERPRPNRDSIIAVRKRNVMARMERDRNHETTQLPLAFR